MQAIDDRMPHLVVGCVSHPPTAIPAPQPPPERVVQQHQLRLLVRSARQAHTLPLPARQVHAALARERAVAVLQDGQVKLQRARVHHLGGEEREVGEGKRVPMCVHVCTCVFMGNSYGQLHAQPAGVVEGGAHLFVLGLIERQAKEDVVADGQVLHPAGSKEGMQAAG